jgi:hypothetical protein
MYDGDHHCTENLRTVALFVDLFEIDGLGWILKIWSR